MTKLNKLGVFLVVMLAMGTFWGCAKKVATTTQAIEVQEKQIAPPPVEGPEREQLPVVKEEPILREALIGEEADFGMLEAIYFDFDQSDIRDDARRILEKNARWFKANPSARVAIEGHCDERGTNEYNLALGQRRAESTKRFLTAFGVDASRLSTISYGEERPVCDDHREGCWQQNRRSNFLVISR